MSLHLLETQEKVRTLFSKLLRLNFNSQIQFRNLSDNLFKMSMKLFNNQVYILSFRLSLITFGPEHGVSSFNNYSILAILQINKLRTKRLYDKCSNNVRAKIYKVDIITIFVLVTK